MSTGCGLRFMPSGFGGFNGGILLGEITMKGEAASSNFASRVVGAEALARSTQY